MSPAAGAARGSRRGAPPVILALFAAAALAGGCGAPAPAIPPASHFIALEERWVEALAKNDTAALDSLLTDDFLDVTFRGEIRSRHDFIMGHRAAPAYHSVGFESIVVRPHGNAVLVTGVNVLQGADSTDVARIRFTDVFVEEGGRWRAASAQETLVAPH